LTKDLVERVLEAELTDHLDYETHAPEGRGSGNSRNGKSEKMLQGEQGKIPIDITRDRNGDFAPEIRKVIYTTNAIESLNSSIRKVIKTRRAFPSDEAALKLIYLALQNIAKRWTMPIKSRKAALNQFAIRYESGYPQDDGWLHKILD